MSKRALIGLARNLVRTNFENLPRVEVALNSVLTILRESKHYDAEVILQYAMTAILDESARQVGSRSINQRNIVVGIHDLVHNQLEDAERNLRSATGST